MYSIYTKIEAQKVCARHVAPELCVLYGKRENYEIGNFDKVVLG